MLLEAICFCAVLRRRKFVGLLLSEARKAFRDLKARASYWLRQGILMICSLGGLALVWFREGCIHFDPTYRLFAVLDPSVCRVRS